MERTKIILTGYLLVVLVNLIAHLLDIPVLATYSKPLLMPILLYYVHEKSAGHVTAKTLWLAAALVFSWGGDIALMYGDTYFLPGVGSFLVAQVIYISLFRKAVYKSPKFSLLKLSPFIAYGFTLFYFILPSTGPLMIPVLIYGGSVLAMVSMARLRIGLTSLKSFQYTFIGAMLFVVSDSILGYAKFVESLIGAQFMIMLTYTMAQYLITEGMLQHQD